MPSHWPAVHLQPVIAGKPQWLCGTFAFHPMLGFRRDDQAKSIAHGCRSTLAELAKIEPEQADAWGITRPEMRDEPYSDNGAKGHCWYRDGCVCPFSRQALEEKAGAVLEKNTRKAVERIHRVCGRDKTHARRDTDWRLVPVPEPVPIEEVVAGSSSLRERDTS